MPNIRRSSLAMELFVDIGERSYPIIIEKGLFSKLGVEVRKYYKEKKIFILTDVNVDSYYGEEVVKVLEETGFQVEKLVLLPGENTKSFNTLPVIYNKMLEFKLTRSDLLITLGGGVIGDLGGFVAATYLRGIDFIQCPTTLLAQVDSSVGGKVGVDLFQGKNLIGNFYHPKAVLIDPKVLDTLEHRYFKDGMAEVIKYGCIKDEELFKRLKGYSGKLEIIHSIEEIIYRCCDIKRQFVEKDERDKGERMILNFGHTIGHGIEQFYNYQRYSHGEAVAIGMYEITKRSEALGITKKGTAEEIKAILINQGLPYEMDMEIHKIIESITLDKKNFSDTLKVILLKNIGSPIIFNTSIEFFKN